MTRAKLPLNHDRLAFLTGGGEMGERTRTFDWSRTPVGSLANWPQSLQTAVRIMLDSRYAMWLGWGPDFTFFYNDAYAHMTLGPKHPWALGRSAREVWKEIWSDIGPRAESVVRDGRATWDEGLLLFLERQGFKEETYHTFSYSPLPDDRGQIGGMLCVVTEDTERTISERRLKTLRELAARTTEAAMSVNDACRRAMMALAENPRDLPFVLLYLLNNKEDRADLIGSAGLPAGSSSSPGSIPLDDAIPFDNTAPWPLAEAVETGKPVYIDQLNKQFGPLVAGAWPEPIERALVLPIAKPGQTKPAGFMVAGISPRLTFSDAYRGFLELLAGHVAAAIANARAYEEERRRAEALAELDQAKTAFFSNVSHEFRTPITLILGPLEELLSRHVAGFAPKVKEELETVHRNGVRLLRLVNSLLDFSRIEAGRAQASFEPTDLATFTAELTSVFRSACERGGLRLLVDCPKLDETAYVDREMWEKIVLNLLSNAFKFTLAGEIAVSLRRTGRAVELRVRDTGIGIPPQEMPRLFDRFHRVQNARGRTHEGSGIGLAHVQELVKLQGGTIAAESELGRGTTFIVTLPLGTAHLAPDRIKSGSNSLRTTSARAYVAEALHWLPDGENEAVEMPASDSKPLDDVNKPLVLIADDNADMRQYVARLLSDQYRVDIASDGEAALASIRQRLPDVVLTDVMMPRLDGFGLLQALRADPRTSSVPIIMLSARAGEESRVDGMQAGADGYLVKPFSGRELLAHVAGHVQMSRIRREASARIAALNDDLSRRVDEFESLMQVLPIGVFLSRDPDCHTITMNPAGAAMLRISQDTNASKSGPEAHRLPFRTMQNGREFAPHDLPMQRAVRTGQPVNAEEMELVFANGDRTTLYEYALPLFDADGAVRGCVGVFVDITNRKLAEEALHQADRRKDEFLATLAHELRNPLAPLRNGLQIMRLASGDPTLLEQSRTMMERQLGQMIRLVDDLLDLSRISRGKIELRKERVEISKVIQHAVETSCPAIEQAGHELTVTMPPGPIYVDADVTRLSQVFANLLNNSAKYTDRGGNITLAVQRGESEVLVSVKDTGIGIPPAMLPRVFDMFTQVDRNLERSHGGLGIGLSIVKRLVEMHGGSIEARSEGTDLGSEFVVQMPIMLSAASDQTQGDVLAAKPLYRRRILVVDDNRDAAVSLATMLELMGNETQVAHDGVSGLAVAEAFRPQVMLLDIGMPKINGYETARLVRKQSWGQAITIIALTGWGQEDDRRKSHDAGFDFHMVKPIEPAALEKLLDGLAAGSMV